MTARIRVLVWLSLSALLVFGYRQAIEPAVQASPALRVVLAPGGITALPIGTVLFVAALLLVPQREKETARYKLAKRVGWFFVVLAWGGLILVGAYVSSHK